jgi:hypothetical protein
MAIFRPVPPPLGRRLGGGTLAMTGKSESLTLALSLREREQIPTKENTWFLHCLLKSRRTA